MKFYDAPFAPNARRVRIFLAEKGVAIPSVEIDLGRLEQRSMAFSALNPFQRIPALELDDGTVIAESVAICRYIDELHPAPPMFGVDALDRALIEMWQRRLELNLLYPILQAFRHTHPAMKEMESPQIAPWAEINRSRAIEAMALIDQALGARPFITGERLSIADITGLVALDFVRPARIAIPEGLSNLRRWREALSARPSARA
jgi:glutathione S-transferase